MPEQGKSIGMCERDPSLTLPDLGAHSETGRIGGVIAAPARTRRMLKPSAALAVAVLGGSMAFIDASSVNIVTTSSSRSRMIVANAPVALISHKIGPALLRIGVGRLPEETHALAVRFIQNSDQAAAARLVTSNLRLVAFGALIIGFLVIEPEGLNRLWRNVRNYFRVWPFAY